MKPSEILRQAGEDAMVVGALCKGAFARDRIGRSVHVRSSRATSWCALGHVRKIKDPHHHTALLYLNQAAQRMGFRWASSLNDTHLELVPDLFSEAIEAAEASGE